MAAPGALTRMSILAATAAAILLGAGGFAARPQSPLPGAPTPGEGAPAAKPEMTETCPGLIASDRWRAKPTGLTPAALTPSALTPAAFAPSALRPDQARITYNGHSTFLIESPKLVRIATDYNDYVRPPLLPDMVTMNHAHSTHYTDRPDPDIKFVLRGWRNDGKPANHDITYSDVHVRSVSTNIRTWNGGTEKNGNSIFIFDIGSLCIAHLGHLHHTLTQQQLDDIGHIDVLMVPVDGSYTMDMEGMVEVVQAIKAPLMVPMHFFSTFTLRRFLDRVSRQYDVEYADTPSFVVSKTALPSKGKFLVLPGY
jgi:L-ascorbate metabolism protein UlaG (beta-lactamase superfamily)